MRNVIEVVCLGRTRLLLTFDNGSRRDVDVATLTDFSGVFKLLKDSAYFRTVRVEPDIGTIAWPNGADFCPDVLFDRSVPERAQETA